MVCVHDCKGEQVSSAKDMSVSEICKQINEANLVLSNAMSRKQFWLEELSRHIAEGNEVILREESK